MFGVRRRSSAAEWWLSRIAKFQVEDDLNLVKAVERSLKPPNHSGVLLHLASASPKAGKSQDFLFVHNRAKGLATRWG
jgi:hypothetical protein